MLPKSLEQQLMDAVFPIILFENVEDVRAAFSILSSKIEHICNNPTDFIGSATNPDD